MKSLIKRVLASPRWAGLAAARLRGSVLILCYHDISPDAGPGNWLRVRQGEFDRQLTWLRGLGCFITPDELPVAGGNGGVGGPASGDAGHGRATGAALGLRFLLTFDDGYVNNFRLALPVLQRHQAPALFFVSTWHAATGVPFWFDRVGVPIQADARGELDLRDAGLRLYRFRHRDDSSRWEDVQRLLVDIKKLGNPGHPAVEGILDRCDQAAGELGRAALAECRPLQAGEIRAMHATGLCHFGSHGHRHEILTYLDAVAQAESLRTSRAFLEAILASPVQDLAYPNGDFNGRLWEAAQATGFRRGYTIEPGVTRPRSAALRIPRLLIGGYDSATILAFKINRLLLRAALA